MRKSAEKSIAGFLAAGLAIFCAAPTFSQETAEQKCFYVDQGAALGGNGTKTSPFKTIDEAKRAVRQMNEAGEYPAGGITVFLRGGRYAVKDTLTFDESDSGAPGAVVKWCAYEDEPVTITMGESIPFEKFSPVENNSRIAPELCGKIYSVTLTEDEAYDMLYMGGHSQIYFYNFGMAEEGTVSGGIPVPWVFMEDTAGTLARYPNSGEYMKTGEKLSGGNLDDGKWYESDNVGGKIEGEIKGFKMKVTDERIKNWENADGARMWGVWCHDWSEFDVGVKEIDVAAKTIESTHPSPYPVKEGKRWYIYNLLEELDSPGEWYLDKASNELYIYPPEGFSSGSEVTLAFKKQDIVKLGAGAKNIEFSGITFSGTRLSGIRLQSPDNIKITDCVFERICSDAVVGYGTNIKISGCEFKSLGCGAIELANLGYSTGLPKSGNEVYDNEICDFGLLGGSYALEIGGSGAEVRGNKIYNSPLGAIGLSGNDHLIEENEMYDLLDGKDDFGVISCVNSMIMRGTVIKNNIIHDIYSSANGTEGVHGIYLDNYQSGYTVTDNLIYNVGGYGVFVNMGRDNTVTGNVFVNLKRGVHISAGYAAEQPTDRSFYGITEKIVKSEAYQKYPHIDTLLDDDWWRTRYNIVRDNYSYDTEAALYLLPKNISRGEAEYENVFEEGRAYSCRERYLRQSEFPYFPEGTELAVKKDGTALDISSGERMEVGEYDVAFTIKDKTFRLIFDVISSGGAVFSEDFEDYEIGETPPYIKSTGDAMEATVADDGTGNKVLKVTYKNEARTEQKYNYLTLSLGENYDFGKYSYDYRVKIVNTASGCLSPFMTLCNAKGAEIMTRQSISQGFVYAPGYVVSRANTPTDDSGYYKINSELDLDSGKQYIPNSAGALTEKDFDVDGAAFSSIKIRGIMDSPLGITAPAGSEYALSDTEVYFIDDIVIAPKNFSHNGMYLAGEAIDSLSSAAGRTVTVRADVGEISDSEPEFTAIFALFDGDTLKEVKTAERGDLKVHHAEAEFTLPEDTENMRIEYMVFKSLSVPVPLTAEKVTYK